MNRHPQPLTADELGMAAGWDIYRTTRPALWLSALERVPEEQRPAAERVLREQGERLKSFRAWRDRSPRERATAAAAALAVALVLALPVLASPPSGGPLLVVAMTHDTPAYKPSGGEPIMLPRGTMIDICGAPTLEYQLDGRLVLLGEPCPIPYPLTRIFRDRFE
jgi:hypothetical protein